MNNTIKKLIGHQSPPQQRSIPYRADLDGLRGIAILMVVYFHNFELYGLVPTHFGFLGVDIFFVLSGYLITKIINTSLDQGTFSFKNFYAHRIRRLFPSLIIAFSIALVWGWAIMDPFFFQHIGGNILYSALSLANVTFAPDKGLYNVQKTIKPFVPLWSLSLEGQFYLFIPILLKGLRSLRAYRWIPFFILALLSFFIQAEKIPSPTGMMSRYYDPLSRFWELLVGVILALIMPEAKEKANSFFHTMKQHKIFLKQSLDNILSFLGGYALLGVIFVTQSQKNLPLKSAFACLGTALLIMASPTAWINQKILSSRFLVSIGLISYPLYLIHWLLISMISMTYANNHNAVTFILKCHKDPILMVCATFVSFALSAVIYRYIEKPLRYSRYTFILCAIMIFLSLTAGLALIQKIHP